MFQRNKIRRYWKHTNDILHWYVSTTIYCNLYFICSLESYFTYFIKSILLHHSLTISKQNYDICQF